MSGEDEERNAGCYIVKCRGLPWSATASDLKEFFSNCNLKTGSFSCTCTGSRPCLKPNFDLDLADSVDNDIHIVLSREGRPSGEAFVELASEEDLEEAVKCDRKHIGKRYVEGKSHQENLFYQI